MGNRLKESRQANTEVEAWKIKGELFYRCMMEPRQPSDFPRCVTPQQNMPTQLSLFSLLHPIMELAYSSSTNQKVHLVLKHSVTATNKTSSQPIRVQENDEKRPLAALAVSAGRRTAPTMQLHP